MHTKYCRFLALLISIFALTSSFSLYATTHTSYRILDNGDPLYTQTMKILAGEYKARAPKNPWIIERTYFDKIRKPWRNTVGHNIERDHPLLENDLKSMLASVESTKQKNEDSSSSTYDDCLAKELKKALDGNDLYFAFRISKEGKQDKIIGLVFKDGALLLYNKEGTLLEDQYSHSLQGRKIAINYRTLSDDTQANKNNNKLWLDVKWQEDPSYNGPLTSALMVHYDSEDKIHIEDPDSTPTSTRTPTSISWRKNPKVLMVAVAVACTVYMLYNTGYFPIKSSPKKQVKRFAQSNKRTL